MGYVECSPRKGGNVSDQNLGTSQFLGVLGFVWLPLGNWLYQNSGQPLLSYCERMIQEVELGPGG